jgi:hypothetical protein
VDLRGTKGQEAGENCIMRSFITCSIREPGHLNGTALGYGMDDRGRGFESRQGLGIFLFTTASSSALGPTEPPIQWVPGALSLEVKRPGCEADYSPHLVPRSKNMWSYTSTPPIRPHGVVLS